MFQKNRQEMKTTFFALCCLVEDYGRADFRSRDNRLCFYMNARLRIKHTLDALSAAKILFMRIIMILPPPSYYYIIFH